MWAKRINDDDDHHIFLFSPQGTRTLYRNIYIAKKTRAKIMDMQLSGCERPLSTPKKVTRSLSLQPPTKIEQESMSFCF